MIDDFRLTHLGSTRGRAISKDDPGHNVMARDETDCRLGDLLDLHAKLLNAAQRWAEGEDVADEIESSRRDAIKLNHLRYSALVPAYQRLARGQNLQGEVDVDTIVNQLMFTDEIFKSYDSSWLESANFPAMTEWLETIFTHAIEVDQTGVTNIGTWRARLREVGVHVTFSSGTSGRMSFVPRDPLTNAALRSTAYSFGPQEWFGRQGRIPTSDCLVLGPRGDGTGIQGAGTGIAHVARRRHFLFDSEWTGDAPGTGSAAGGDRHYHAALEFMRQSVAEQRPLFIFGAPVQVKRFCEFVISHCGQFKIDVPSLVGMGGGWKTLTGDRITQHRLQELIEQAFGLPASQTGDVYSTSELNCIMISCAESRYHVPPLLEPVVLDEAFIGSAGSEGTGVLGFLDPFAISYPGFIITGDVGSLRRGVCGCGLSGWYVDGEIQRLAGWEVKGCGGVMASITA